VAPPDEGEPKVAALAKGNPMVWVLMFGVVLLGCVYFFWDSMHVHFDPHMPEMVQVEGEAVEGEGDLPEETGMEEGARRLLMRLLL
jgi:hypothetical protein